MEVLHRQGIIPGIKVDKGAKALAGFSGEKITEGLDGLRERLVEYREFGARFTKWRAVIAISATIPGDTCLRANAHALARFAALSQEAGLMPIVEPEVLMDGDHDIGRHAEVTHRALRIVFDALAEHRVYRPGASEGFDVEQVGPGAYQVRSHHGEGEATLYLAQPVRHDNGVWVVTRSRTR